jgi:hypothetical protein
MMDRKKAVRDYKEKPRPAGVYRVQHTPSGRTLLGSSSDAPAMLNRIRFQLMTKGHPNQKLQADWNSGGTDDFLFEVLDLLPPRESEDEDPGEELAALEELWSDKLKIEPGLRY